MTKVSLHDALFFAFHGFYPEEQLLGSKFSVTIEMEFESDDQDDDLNKTANYEQLYQIAAKEMKETRKLLETVAQSMTDKVAAGYPFYKKVVVEVKKLNPPLGGEVAWSAVTVTKHNNAF